MPNFSWNANGPNGGYYYPDPGGSFQFSSGSEASAAPPPPGTTGPVDTTIQTGPTTSSQPTQAQQNQTDTQQADAAAQIYQQQTNQNAVGVIDQLLSQLGLSSLSQWAWNEITNGSSVAQVQLDLQQQPAFQQRFPYLTAMQTQGLNVPSVADMLATETAYKQVQQSFGVTPSDNPQDYLPLFVQQVSPSEFTQRLQDYHDLVHLYGPYITEQFQNYAGITGMTNDQLYNALSGQDPSIFQQYSNATGTQHTPLSFADIQTAFQMAQEAKTAETQQGGSVQTGESGAEQQNILERQRALPSSNA